MPGDRIIREGERGTEMFFVTEGTAQIIIRKAASTPRISNAKRKSDLSDIRRRSLASNALTSPQGSIFRIYKNKGDYFGEVGPC